MTGETLSIKLILASIIGALILIANSGCTTTAKEYIPIVKIIREPLNFNCGKISSYYYTELKSDDTSRLTPENAKILLDNLALREKEVLQLRLIVWCYENQIELYNKVLVNTRPDEVKPEEIKPPEVLKDDTR